MDWVKSNIKELAIVLGLFSGGVGVVWTQIIDGLEAKSEIKVRNRYRPVIDSLNHEIFNYQLDIAVSTATLEDC